jgi:hypothetical protein
MSWTAPKMPKERPPNTSIDAAVLHALNRDPVVSLPGIAKEVKLPVLIVFYVLRSRMRYIYRRCRLVPYMLSPQHRPDHLKQSRELCDAFQNEKTLQWRFILTGDEPYFSSVNKHEKHWLPPDAEATKPTRRVTVYPM